LVSSALRISSKLLNELRGTACQPAGMSLRGRPLMTKGWAPSRSPEISASDAIARAPRVANNQRRGLDSPASARCKDTSSMKITVKPKTPQRLDINPVLLLIAAGSTSRSGPALAVVANLANGSPLKSQATGRLGSSTRQAPRRGQSRKRSKAGRFRAGCLRKTILDRDGTSLRQDLAPRGWTDRRSVRGRPTDLPA
jgi:hypothetical protein